MPELDPAAYGVNKHERLITFDNVARTTTGFNEVLTKFLSKFVDIDIEHVGEAVFILVEQMFIDVIAANDLTCFADKQFSECIFTGSELDGLALEGDCLVGSVDADIADREFGVALPCATTGDRTGARNHLGKIEGLG